MKHLPKHFLVLYFLATEIFGEKCDLTDTGCNKTNTNEGSKMEGFIVGGHNSGINEFPHAVCLFQYPLYRVFCGSSVLNQQVLLTAAHCVEGEGEFSFDAYAGHEDMEKVTIIRKVSRFVMHEKYSQETTQNDIAILFLDDGGIPIGGISPVKRVIISKQFPLDVKEAEISGWGYVNVSADLPDVSFNPPKWLITWLTWLGTSFSPQKQDATRETSTILKSTSQHVIPLQECSDTYFYEWLPGMMCAGDANSDADRPSRGDSGGALMTPDHQQIGVVSFTTAEQRGLVFYTNISYYYDWIVRLVEDKICE